MASLTALFEDMQSGPKECGKATREHFLSSVRACQSKISKWREIRNYLYLVRRMKCENKDVLIYIYIKAQVYRWIYCCKALKEGRCEVKLGTGSQSHLLTGKALRADFFPRSASAKCP